MKKILLSSAILALFAGQAMANSIYITGKVGGSNGEANSIENETKYDSSAAILKAIPANTTFNDNVVAWGGAVGYKYTNWIIPLRMEAEYLYRNHYNYNTGNVGVTHDKAYFTSHVNNQTILANFYADVPITRMFGIFFGGGFGEAINTSYSKATGTAAGGSPLTGSVDDANFSWMTTAGLTVEPLKWLAFDLSYRYSDLGNISWRVGAPGKTQAALETDSFAAQELFLGVRIDIPNMYKKPHHKKAHKYMDK
jgi:opacity protein-like surface antigen